MKKPPNVLVSQYLPASDVTNNKNKEDKIKLGHKYTVDQSHHRVHSVSDLELSIVSHKLPQQMEFYF